MPEFGSFETVDELSQHGPTAVYSARRARTQEPALYVVKTFIPLSVSEQAKRDIDRFLKAARSQQKVATGEGRSWAPILECGTVAGGAFYVTRLYPRSVQQLIDGRVKLSHGALCRIIQRVATGLIQLKQATGRSHGNLKPGKVLISGERELSRAEVVLTDAVESAAAQSAAGEPADLRAVGHIIHQLVVHRPFTPEDSWPIQPSEKWARLGKNAEPWRELCQRLLDPKRGPFVTSVEELAREVSSFRQDRLFNPVKVALAALAVAVAVAASVAVYRYAEPIGRFIARMLPGSKEAGEVQFDPAKWKALCEEYHDWFGLFCNQLDREKAPERWASWSKDKYLSENVLSVTGSGGPAGAYRLNPREIANADPRVTFQQLGSKAPESARTPEAARQCDQALRTIGKVKLALTEGWPLLSSYRQMSAQWRARGWQGPAKHVESLVGGLTTENPELVAAVEAAMAAAPAVEAVQKSWSDVQTIYEQKMKESGFPPVKDFLEAYADRLKAAKELDGLRGELQRVAAFANLLAGFLDGDWKRIDRAKLSGSGLSLQLPAEPITSQAKLDSWLKPLKALVQEGPDRK